MASSPLFSDEVLYVMDKEFLAAQEEWNAVASISGANKSGPIQQYMQGDEVKALSSSVSPAECIEYFRTHINLPLHKRDIKPTIQYTRLRSCFNLFFGPPNLLPVLKDDRDLIFAMAAWPLENEDTVHLQMLYTIYKQLTNSKLDPPRYGAHWDDIGFQGTDPATDLRGGGCLGLVNMLYLATEDKYKEVATFIFSLSRHPVQNFPFGVMSLNITRIALHALRSQHLNKHANRTGDVIGLFNEFYVAAFLHLGILWKFDHKTIHDSGHVIKNVEAYCCKNVAGVLNRLSSNATEDMAVVPASAPLAAFTDLDKV